MNSNNYEYINIKFSDGDKSVMSEKQLDLANYFENFNSNNIIYLNNCDFEYGTYRITEPGIYKLQEDIVFHPNADNDFNPKPEQFEKYPMNAYHLGFFAAITIEAKGNIRFMWIYNKTIKRALFKTKIFCCY